MQRNRQKLKDLAKNNVQLIYIIERKRSFRKKEQSKQIKGNKEAKYAL